MYHWRSEHDCAICLMTLRHILAVLCEMFPITRISMDRYRRTDCMTSTLHARFQSSGHVTCGNSSEPLCMQLPLTTKRYYTTALWLPVRVSATTPAALNGGDNIWWDVSRSALNLVETIFKNYYTCKYTLLAITHKWNVSGHIFLRTFTCSDLWNS
jgi:hypothetical protein